MMSAREAGIGIGGLIVGAVVGGLTWSSLFQKDDTLVLPEARDPGMGARPKGDMASENTRLKAEIANLRAELDRKRLAVAQEQAKAPEESKANDPEASTPMEALFADPRFEKALATIDWDAVGNSMKDMVPLIAKLAEAMAAGERPDLELVGEIHKLNGELLKAAQKIMEGNIPGTGINGSFTHPVVVANQFGAALKAAGLDLSKEQKETLDRAMRFYAAKDESLRLGEGDRELKLDVLAEEAEFKDAFYKEARSMLTEEQRNALFDEHSAGRTQLDVFDSSLMLAQYARPVRVKSASELASTLSDKIASGIRLDASNRKQLDAVLTRWSNELPAEFWADKASTLDKSGMMSGARVRAALRRQTQLVRQILANVKLSPQARARLVKSMVILVPLPE
jgi:hypothetical protein